MVSGALTRLGDFGMAYLPLGQKVSTLSTGELQKLRLIKFLHRSARDGLFLLDEPSFGLHARDVEVVLGLIDQLLAGGNTVVAVEHNLRVLSRADWVLELGPEGGDAGGHLLFAGPVGELIARNDTPTGRCLKKMKQTP
jgi:excinuclease ABC subunit A